MSRTKLNITTALFDIKPMDETGRVDVGRIEAVSARLDLRTKKAPTDPTSAKLMNSVGAAYSTISPRLSPIHSIAVPKLKSSETVDNQKPRFSEVVGSVDGTGFAPVGSLVTTQDRYYTPPTVRQSYQLPNKKQNPAKLLEEYLNSNLNIRKELRNIGGKTVRPIFAKQKSGISKPKFLISKQSLNFKSETPNDEGLTMSPDDYQTILSQINQRVLPETAGVLIGEPRRIYPFERLLTTSQVGTTCDVGPSPSFAEGYGRAQPEIESWINYAKTQKSPELNLSRLNLDRRFNLKKFKIPKLALPKLKLKHKSKSLLLAYVLTGLSAFIIFTSFGLYGVNLKNEIIKEGNSAVASLEQAEKNLKVFDFEAASNNFAGAYEEFSKAGDNLNFMGASITSIFSELPGAGKLKSAKNLVEAGRLLAEAGKSMSEAVSSLSQTSAILNYTGQTSNYTGLTSIGNLKKSLLASSRNLSKAGALLSDVSSEALPEDKKEAFLKFKSKLPEFEDVVLDAVEYTSFLENLLGSNGTKTYLVLFQNDSELRPTGGFPGTYGVVTFKDGQLRDVLVDDVYNLDGQLKEDIIPPEQLQHITPTWGMRDASWFIDFSVSAQKVMEFFKKESGYEVDGVLTVNPRIISEILKIVGPIEMSEYGAVINDENFVSTIQEEIEYGENRQQPKKIVVDMAPKLLEKINSADPSQWLEIFNVFMSGLDEKDILMYFKDLNLENFVAEKGFGGLIKDTRTIMESTRTDSDGERTYADTDYLMVTFSNIKGSKTDRVIDNHLKLVTEFKDLNIQKFKDESSTVVHKLTITRQHDGGDTGYGFYNKQNPAYVRILVPEEAELINISGNSIPEFKPLISYSGNNFKIDKDLFNLESGFSRDRESGVSVYKESGKTGFAFWMITDPGEKKTVELEYSVPLNSESGEYKIYIQKQPGLEVDNFEFVANGSYTYNGEFDKDMEFRIGY